MNSLVRPVAAIFLAASMVAACGPKAPRGPYMSTDPGVIDAGQNGRGLVIMSARFEKDGMFGRSNKRVRLIFERGAAPNAKKNPNAVKNAVQIWSSGRAQVLAVPEGDYALRNISFEAGTRALASFSSRAWDRKTGRPAVAGFSVKRGEVVYLGDLKVRMEDPKKARLTLEMSDRFAAAKSEAAGSLDKNGAEILSRAKTRLMKVPPVIQYRQR